MKTVFTIGVCLPGNVGRHIGFKSDTSLLDADVVLMRMDMSDIDDYGMDTYQGKRCYGEHASFELKECIARWQRELQTATESGKTVFILLNDKHEVFVDSGQREYSGTGRNRKTTRLLEPRSNYDVLPFGNQFTGASGQVMVLSDKAAWLRTYWDTFGPMSRYRAIIGGAVTTPLLLSKDRKHVLGALIRFKGSTGSYVLLPDVDFDGVSGLTRDREGEPHWTKKASAVGQQFLEAILGIDEVLRSESTRTVVPPWAKDRAFDLPVERKINGELLRLEERKRALQTEEAGLRSRLGEETMLKGLLYEQGTALEAAIIRALEIMGFSASRFRDSDSEFDVVFASTEGRFIGEAEGKDSKAVNIDKLRQLEMNIHEDFARDGVKEMAKAVLFGNAARLTPPRDRNDFFTEKCLTAAKRMGCALVRTPDLFWAARSLVETPSAEFAKRCREAILAASPSVSEYMRQYLAIN